MGETQVQHSRARVPTIVLVSPDDFGVSGRRVRLRERVLVRVHAFALDRQLADGAPVDSDPILALRALELVRPRRRRALAKDLHNLMAECERRPAPLARSGSPIRRERVRQAVPELSSVIDHLLAPVPVSARAMAQVRLLLTDGMSPLFRPGTVAELRAQARRIADSLEPLANW